MKKYLTLENLGWGLNFVVIYLLVNAGISKILGTQEMVNNFTFLNLTPYLSTVGVLEFVAASLLAFNRTALFGAILTTSIMSAAIVMHLSYMGGQNVVFPFTVAVLGWASYYLRNFKTISLV
jgi:uncharacterized membrane protein YphA (DoxX/SURF4 family)